MPKRIIGLILLLLFFKFLPVKAQQQSRDEDFGINSRLQSMKPIALIDIPTANFMPRKYFQLKLRMYSIGGMLAGLKVGLTPRLMFGVTYGVQNVIGYGKVNWNDSPGVNVRYRIRFEDLRFPAISLGFNSQGYSTYYSKLKRYQIKALGFYVIASKNYIIIKDLSIH